MNNSKTPTIVIFGEAEKGEFRTAYYLKNLFQTVDYLGNPPPETKGLFYAVQALMYDFELIFFRVEEEGFSRRDYFYGMHIIENQNEIPNISAFSIPGVGDGEIIRALTSLCTAYNSVLILSEADLYDYLTEERLA